MRIIKKSINDIHPYENNPRVNDAAVEKVAESIRAYGMNQPIVVDSEGVIIAGHTRYEALKLLGKTKVEVYEAPLSKEQAAAYRLADNKVADYSFWDNKKLLEELDKIGTFDDVGGLFTGFTVSDIFTEMLDEKDKLELDGDGEIYEITFKATTKERCEEARRIWEELKDGSE